MPYPRCRTAPERGQDEVSEPAPETTTTPLRWAGEAAPPPTSPLVCLREAGGQRRLFVLRAGREVRCGRRKPVRGDTRPNHLVLRLLPCDAQRHPENWRATLAISSQHLQFVLAHDGLRLIDLGRNGTLLDGRPMQPRFPARLRAQFQIMLGGVLRLRGRIEAPDGSGPIAIDPDAPLPLTGPLAPDAALAGAPEACLLERVANTARDSYLLLYRRATIGKSGERSWRVSAPGVAARHAALLQHRGALLLAALAPEGRTVVNGRALAPGTFTALVPGMELEFGESRWVLEAARPADLAHLPDEPRT
ncbi:MAG: FHA domain-containing protein [Planctomycetota bacterium]|nr:MAG: FHA domain-containing protein [Planctomycetota bacterium]